MKKNWAIGNEFVRKEGADFPQIRDGARIAVIGGGPAGSFFSIFLLDFAATLDFHLSVDIFEPRDFSAAGPKGCNMCGGVISETLIETLATEGIFLPASVVQRTLDSYVLHLDEGNVRIATPLQEMRIGTIHRGAGPRDLASNSWQSFDGFLQGLAVDKGAKVIPQRVSAIARANEGISIAARDAPQGVYDLVVAAVGVNSSILNLLETSTLGYRRPLVTKTLIREYRLGADLLNATLGNAMHVFLLDIPGLEFAAAIPKGEYATFCFLGEKIDAALTTGFMESRAVKDLMPRDWDPRQFSCQCMPHINIRAATKPYGERMVFIGDCGATRLYKDGIGAAYRTGKAAARAAIFGGLSGRIFERRYFPVCRRIVSDNAIGKLLFGVTSRIQRHRVLRRALLHRVAAEQTKSPRQRRVSRALWNVFSGSAPYADILRTLAHPFSLAQFLWSLISVTLAKRSA